MLFEAAVTHSKTVRGFTEDAMRFLAAYDWPGNLPELRTR
jgi:two-component system response regulator HupR/HoxA